MHREKDPPLRAYVLRCWHEGEVTPGAKQRWRFSVEEILQRRYRKGFDNLEALVAFLQEEFSVADGSSAE
jgi:hypothetical protein